MQGCFNHANHPGRMPVNVPISQMNDKDKMNDRTNSIFHVNVEKANCGAMYKPVKNGIIYWQDKVNFSSYVDLYFQEDAEFAKVPNWQQIMIDSFDNWQRSREGKTYDLRKREVSIYGVRVNT